MIHNLLTKSCPSCGQPTEEPVPGHREQLERLVGDIEAATGVARNRIFSRQRTDDVCAARFFLYSIMRNLGYTWMFIGEFAGRDHGAAIYGASRLHRRLSTHENNDRPLKSARDFLKDKDWDVSDKCITIKDHRFV